MINDLDGWIRLKLANCTKLVINFRYLYRNVKELIPEFYQESTEFLLNDKMLDMGVRANNKRVDHIKLPNWARTPEEFLRKHREALESDYVS